MQLKREILELSFLFSLCLFVHGIQNCGFPRRVFSLEIKISTEAEEIWIIFFSILPRKIIWI